MKTTLRLIALGALLLAPAAAAARGAATTILECNFDSKPIDQVIGTGGPSVGEPISLGELPATVRANPFPTPCLDMTEDWGFGSRHVRFEFLDGVAIATGVLDVSFDLQFAALNGFTAYLRERGSSAVSFLNITFSSDGFIMIGDLNSSGARPVGNYQAGVVLPVQLTFDLGALTWDMSVNGSPLVNDEPLGRIPEGIGAFLIGLDHDADSEGTFYMDNLKVTATEVPQPVEAESWGGVKARF